MMKSFLIVSILLVLVSSIVNADAAGDAFVVRLQLSEKTIYPYEPVEAQLTLVNTSQKPEILEMTGSRGVAVRKANATDYRFYSRPHPFYSPPIPMPRTFEAGQKEESFLTIDIDGASREHVFAAPDLYSVKGWFHKVNSLIESKPALLTVQQPLLAEQNAVRYLDKHKIHMYFAPDSARDFVSGWSPDSKFSNPFEQLNELEDFVKQFPTSRYAFWARLAILVGQEALVNKAFQMQSFMTQTPRFNESLRKSYGQETLEKILEPTKRDQRMQLAAIEKQLADFAREAPKPINGLAWLEAGLIAQNRGESVVALAYYDKAIATNANAVFVERVRFARQFLPAAQIRKPEPADIWKQTVKDLEAKRYDTKNFSVDHPKEYLEYAKEVGRLPDNLSREDYYRRASEIFRSYVTKYLQPLTPEGWEKRKK